MFTCIDRHDHDHGVHVGDFIRLPASLQSGEIKSQKFIVIAFGGQGFAHCAILQRLSDRKTQVVSIRIAAFYKLGDGYHKSCRFNERWNSRLSSFRQKKEQICFQITLNPFKVATT